MARDIAAYIENIRQQIEKDLGEPVAAVLPSLSGSGSLAGVGLSQLSGALGMMQQRKANRRTGGSAGITFGKNRYGMLVLGGDGRLKLFRTKLKSRGPQIEEQVGQWEPGQVQVTIVRARKVFTITLMQPGIPDIALEMTDMMGTVAAVEPFANAINVQIT